MVFNILAKNPGNSTNLLLAWPLGVWGKKEQKTNGQLSAM